MAQLNTFYKVLDKLINRFTSNGFLQVTYGTEVDIEVHNKENKYPLAHIVLPTGSFNNTTTTLNFTIMVCDKIDKTGNLYPQYGKDNLIDIQNDLMVKMESSIQQLDQRYLNEYDSIQVGYDINYDVTFTSFKDETPELLGGFIVDLSVSFPNMTETICK